MSYSYSYETSGADMSPAMMAVIFIPTIIVSVFLIVSMWKVFVKCDEAGWKCLIPFYNTYIQFKLFWGERFLGPFLLALLVPFVNFVILIMLSIRMARSFDKGAGFAVGLIFLSFIFIPILAFGSDEYVGPNGDIYARSAHS